MPYSLELVVVFVNHMYFKLTGLWSKTELSEGREIYLRKKPKLRLSVAAAAPPRFILCLAKIIKGYSSVTVQFQREGQRLTEGSYDFGRHTCSSLAPAGLQCDPATAGNRLKIRRNTLSTTPKA
jgi:hypothetical protein